MKHTLDELPEIFDRHPQDPSSLIMVLQDIQKEYHYLPCEALEADGGNAGGSAEQGLLGRDLLQCLQPEPEGRKSHPRLCRHRLSHSRRQD